MQQKDIILLFQFMKASSENKKLLESANHNNLLAFIESDDVYYVTKIVEACVDRNYEKVPFYVHEYRKKKRYSSFQEAIKGIVGEKELAAIYETKIDPMIYRASGIAELFLSARKPAKVAAILSHLYESARKDLSEMTTTGDIAGYDAPVGYSSRDVEKVRQEKKKEENVEDVRTLRTSTEKVLMEEETQLPEEKQAQRAQEISNEMIEEIKKINSELCAMIEELVSKLTLDEGYRQYIMSLVETIEETGGEVQKLVALADVIANLRRMLPSIEAVFLYTTEEKKSETENKENEK